MTLFSQEAKTKNKTKQNKQIKHKINRKKKSKKKEQIKHKIIRNKTRKQTN